MYMHTHAKKLQRTLFKGFFSESFVSFSNCVTGDRLCPRYRYSGHNSSHNSFGVESTKIIKLGQLVTSSELQEICLVIQEILIMKFGKFFNINLHLLI